VNSTLTLALTIADGMESSPLTRETLDPEMRSFLDGLVVHLQTLTQEGWHFEAIQAIMFTALGASEEKSKRLLEFLERYGGITLRRAGSLRARVRQDWG
jgi:hypothetical protein